MKRATRLSLAAMAALMSAGFGGTAVSSEGTRFSIDRQEHARRDFGDVHFVMGSGQAMPWLEMYVSGRLIAAYRYFDAEEVYGSPDGNYFLAISNKAHSVHAYAVLDRGGLVVFPNPHTAPVLNYCGRSGGNRLNWIDTSHPVARFEMQEGSPPLPARTNLKSVTVRGCDGRDVLLGKSESRTEPKTIRAGQDCAAPSRSAEPPVGSPDRASFFIGSTICNLRGLDPMFGERTLTLIDARRTVAPATPARGAVEAAPATDDAVGARN